MLARIKINDQNMANAIVINQNLIQKHGERAVGVCGGERRRKESSEGKAR